MCSPALNTRADAVQLATRIRVLGSGVSDDRVLLADERAEFVVHIEAANYLRRVAPTLVDSAELVGAERVDVTLTTPSSMREQCALTRLVSQ